MDDKTLLERAARAAGIDAQWDCHERGMMMTPDGVDTMTWNPLLDDGDALRLMVTLRLCVEVVTGCTNIGNVTWIEDEDEGEVDGVIHGSDPLAATRRAIVRAAAAIGSAHEAQ